MKRVQSRRYRGCSGHICSIEKIVDKWYYGFCFPMVGFYILSHPFETEEAAWLFLAFIAEDGRWEQLK